MTADTLRQHYNNVLRTRTIPGTAQSEGLLMAIILDIILWIETQEPKRDHVASLNTTTNEIVVCIKCGRPKLRGSTEPCPERSDADT